MRRASLAIVTLAAVAAGAAGEFGGLAALGRQSSGESCAFAVLRRDGIIIPFASYDGGRWQDRWPEPGRKIDIPISVADTPKGWWLRDRPVSTWTAWPFQGESRTIHVRNPLAISVECTRQVGLQTDYSSNLPPVPPDMQPHPKDGLATAGDVPVEPVNVLNAQSPEWPRVLDAIKGPFEASEARAVSVLPGNRLEKDPKRRAQFPLEIELLARAPGPRPGTQTFYFEAVRRYGRRPSQTATITNVPDRRPLAYGAGWVTMAADGKIVPELPVTVELSDNQREDLLYAMPLGTFQVGGRRYWAVQRAGWGFERYEVLEIAEPQVKVIFKTIGGSCR